MPGAFLFALVAEGLVALAVIAVLVVDLLLTATPASVGGRVFDISVFAICSALWLAWTWLAARNARKTRRAYWVLPRIVLAVPSLLVIVVGTLFLMAAAMFSLSNRPPPSALPTSIGVAIAGLGLLSAEICVLLGGIAAWRKGPLPLLCVAMFALACGKPKKNEQPTVQPSTPAPKVGSSVRVNKCADGACEIARGDLVGIAGFGDALFFASSYAYERYKIVEVPADSNQGRVIAATTEKPAGMIADETAVYWATSVYGTDSTGRIRRLDRESGEIETLADKQSFPGHLALDATHVYWINSGDQRPGVFRVKKAGGKVDMLTKTKNVGSLAVTAGRVYYASNLSEGGTFRMDKVGGEPERVLKDGAKLFAEGDAMYGAIWHGWFDSEYVRITDDGKPETLGTGESSTALAVDGKHLYLADEGSHEILSFPKKGGTAVKLVTGAGTADTLAVAGDYLFWSTGQQLGRVRRP